MSGVGGLFILGREAAAWFGGLAIPSKLTVVTIVVATTSVGVAVVAPDVLPISPFTSSHSASVFPAPAMSAKTAAPVNPSIVASAKAPATGQTTTVTQPPTSTTGDHRAHRARGGRLKGDRHHFEQVDQGRPDQEGHRINDAHRRCRRACTTRTARQPWKAGAAPLHVGQPGYRVELDPDKDGVACDKRS